MSPVSQMAPADFEIAPMPYRPMSLEDAARYLHLSPAELQKLVSRDHINAHKVSGKWRFYRPDLNEWLERQFATLNGQDLVKVERQISARAHVDAYEPLVSDLLSPYSVNLTCPSRTKPSVLRGMVQLAEASGLVYDVQAVTKAVIEREDLYSTAIGPGVAFPHPRHPMPNAIGDSIIAFARTPGGVPFGAPDGSLTDLFFLVIAADDQTHLRTLARLVRLVREDNIRDMLRTVTDIAECVVALRDRELTMFGPEADG